MMGVGEGGDGGGKMGVGEGGDGGGMRVGVDDGVRGSV